ncbi:hypothetical protein [Ciceribacter lividus]|nr:hypothetical protein [Ciceribacter lividus]
MANADPERNLMNNGVPGRHLIDAAKAAIAWLPRPVCRALANVETGFVLP